MIESIVLYCRNFYVTYSCQCCCSEWLFWTSIAIVFCCLLGIAIIAYMIVKVIVKYKQEKIKRELDYLEMIRKL